MQTRFLKHVLYVNKNTSNDLVYGELGVYPIDIQIKCRTISFCLRMINGKQTKLSYLMYKCLFELDTSGTCSSPWITDVKNTCNDCGMPGAWLMQGVDNPKHFKKTVE